MYSVATVVGMLVGLMAQPSQSSGSSDGETWCSKLARVALQRQTPLVTSGRQWSKYLPALAVNVWSEVSAGARRQSSTSFRLAHQGRSGRQDVGWGAFVSLIWRRTHPERPSASASSTRETWRVNTQLIEFRERRLRPRSEWPSDAGGPIPRESLYAGPQVTSPVLDAPRASDHGRRVYHRVLGLCREYLRHRRIARLVPQRRSQDHLSFQQTAALLRVYLGRSLDAQPSFGGHP